MGKLRISDGHLIWTFTTGGPVSSSPALTSDMVFFGSQDGGVYAVPVGGASHATGFRTNGAVFSSPVIDNGVIYIGSSDHNVYALGTDGNQHWSFKTGDAANGRFAVANGVVYAASHKPCARRRQGDSSVELHRREQNRLLFARNHPVIAYPPRLLAYTHDRPHPQPLSRGRGESDVTATLRRPISWVAETLPTGCPVGVRLQPATASSCGCA